MSVFSPVKVYVPEAEYVFDVVVDDVKSDDVEYSNVYDDAFSTSPIVTEIDETVLGVAVRLGFASCVFANVFAVRTPVTTES